MSEDAQAPSVEGDLSQRPVAHLILQLFKKQVTGRLVLRDDTGDASMVYLRDGAIVHVERPNDQDRLDRVLIDGGMVSRPVLTRAQQLATANNKRLGQVLIELGAIDAEGLGSAIRAQVRRKMIRLFFVTKGIFRLYIEEHGFGQSDDLAQVRVDPRTFLHQGIRTAYDDPRLIKELQLLSNRSFRLITLPDGYLEALGLHSGDGLFRTLGKQSLMLDDLSGFPGKTSDVRASVLTLLYSDLLATKELGNKAAHTLFPGVEPVRAPQRSPVPPAREEGAPATSLPTVGTDANTQIRDAQNQAVVQKVEELFGRLHEVNHFEVLGLSEAASPEQVNTAYMKAIKSYHPDRLSGMGLASLAPKAERVVARMTEASQILGDAKKRTEYVRTLRGEKSENKSARDVLEAEQTFKDGEQCLTRGDLKKAMHLFNEAVKKSPKETEYRAYLAWARYLDTARKEMIARDTLRMIADALTERPTFARGHFWTGKIHAALGAEDLAEKSFKKCLEVDAEFIDAQREIRLLTMRRQKGTTGKPDDAPRRPTLLNRLLKRGD